MTLEYIHYTPYRSSHEWYDGPIIETTCGLSTYIFNTSEDYKNVDCPQCKETWEYIEKLIEKDHE